MVLARVVGTVVSTSKAEQLNNLKLVLLEKVGLPEVEGMGEYVVALDAVGSNEGEVVLYVTGSSARMTEVSKGRPADAVVSAIVDRVDMRERCVYRKGTGGGEG